MRKLNRLTMTLALLIAAVGGAWAQTAFGVKEITADMLPASWSTDESAVTADDLAKLGFMEVTKDAAKTWTGAPQEGTVRLVYTLCESVNWVNGKGGSESTYNSRKIFYSCLDGQKIFITTEITEWPLTSQDGKNWILDKMPANNIELQVEYYTESNLFLSKEALADKASIAVTAGELGVQFSEDGKSANPVAEGTAMTVKYSGAKKVLGMKVGKYNPDPKAVPLTFEVLTNGTIKVSFPRNGMKYSLNGGEKTAVPGGSESDISVKAGDIIEFYGNGSSYYNMGSDHTSIGGTAEVKVYGNIMSLLSETNFATATTLTAEQTFRELFRYYDKLTDASGLLLPAMTLTNNCYYEMFYSCSGMTAAPAELPAETLASSCYYEMFSSCSKLTTAPVLPATSLVSNCYRSMFSYCSKLSSVTCLATSGIDSNYSTYNWMLYAGSQAAGDKTFTADKTAEWPDTGNGIPSGWTRVDYVAPGN